MHNTNQIRQKSYHGHPLVLEFIEDIYFFFVIFFMVRNLMHFYIVHVYFKNVI